MDKRRRLCEGDEAVSQLKVLQAEKKDEIQREKSITHAKFYCEYCGKQYSSVAEWDVSSLTCKQNNTEHFKIIKHLTYISLPLFIVPGSHPKLRSQPY